MSQSLALTTAEKISAAESEIVHNQILVGLDGFVDNIMHVVDKRLDADNYERMSKMGDFGGRISAAAGLSMNFEFITKMVKLGGNGPIMANAMHSYGAPITYIGNLGSPTIHPVFEDFDTRVRVVSLAEPGITDAIEFDDGKLMCGKHESLKEVNWENLISKLPIDELIKTISGSSLIALVNWTMLTQMTDILEKLLVEVAPKLEGDKRWLFFDLADPSKRTSEDIAYLLQIIAKFQPYFKVILGLNLNESHQIGDVLGINAHPKEKAEVAQHAADIREKLNIENVVVHPTAFAAAADANGTAVVAGPLCDKPKITTGAGDHFNAGYCIGRTIGCDLEESLQIGVATSGFYVRNAMSPDVLQISEFLKSIS